MSEITNELIFEVLKKVQATQADMRAEAIARDEKAQAQIGTVAQGQVSIRTELQGLREDVNRMSGHVREITIAVDHHSTRLDSIETRLDGIEQHLGLDKTAH